jgi:hypothetical protein
VTTDAQIVCNHTPQGRIILDHQDSLVSHLSCA